MADTPQTNPPTSATTTTRPASRTTWGDVKSWQDVKDNFATWADAVGAWQEAKGNNTDAKDVI